MLTSDLPFKAHKFHKFLFRQHLDINIFQRTIPFHGIVVIQFLQRFVDPLTEITLIRRIVTG